MCTMAMASACTPGLSVFEHQIRGSCVHLFSDNKGAEAATRKGGARSFDHTCVVHSIWSVAHIACVWFCVCAIVHRLRALELGICLRVDRVPSKENLSDDPSRERYSLLESIRAVWVKPWLHPSFEHPKAWESLRVVEGKLLKRASAGNC